MRRVFHQGTYTPILNTYGKDTSGFFYLISGLSLFLGDTILAARTAAALVGALTGHPSLAGSSLLVLVFVGGLAAISFTRIPPDSLTVQPPIIVVALLA